MLFASLSFGLFTLIAFALYWATDRVAFRNAVIATVSLFLYYWWEPRFLPLLLYFILVNFLLGRLSEMFPSRRFTIVCVLLNLLPLATYKYWNFAKENIQLLVSPAAAWSLEPVILPLGISFFAFQGLGYILDVRSRTVPPCRDLVQFTAFKAFFPLLLAGPIERAPNLLKQFSEARRFDAEDVAVGGRYFLWGFFKKLAVADQLAPLVDSAFSNVPLASPLHLCVATFFFAFQIYFDFSAYSDMAIGVGRMFGFQLRRNFAFPYFSRNIVEFWRRWHISLSGWFRDYLYIPMGGNRGTAQRRALAILITFLVSGLWHGAAWNFVAWGAAHGIAVLAATWFGARSSRAKEASAATLFSGWTGREAMGVLGTFALTSLLWIVFRAADLSTAYEIYAKILNPAQYFAHSDFRLYGNISSVTAFCAIGFVMMAEAFTTERWVPLEAISRQIRPVRWLAYSLLFWVSVLSSANGVVPFVYFHF